MMILKTKASKIKASKHVLLASILSFSAIMTIPAVQAADEHNVVPGLTAAGAPLGLHGVDPVAFVDIGNRSKGTATFTSVHDGVAYYFSSAANKSVFEKSPSKYVPQNGGFCTFGVSVGKKFDGNPNYSSVVGGKLYVFLNEDIYKMFLNDEQGTIKKAKQNWRKIEHKSAATL